MSWLNLFTRKKAESETVTPQTKKESLSTDSHKPEQTNESSTSVDAYEKIKTKIELAKQVHRGGNIAEAESVYKEVIKSHPDFADAHHMFAIVCLQKGDLATAEKFFKQAITLDENQADFYSNLGNALAAQNKTEQAYDSFIKAIDLDPGNITAMGNAVTALLEMNRVSKAKELCIKLLSIEPNDITSLMNLASIQLEEREPFAAIETLHKALQVQPGNVDVLIQLASNLELVNKLDDANEVIRKAISINPNIAKACLIHGVVARRRNDLCLAQQQLNLALQQGLSAKEQLEALNQLGLCLDKQGKNKDAFVAFSKSNQLMKQVTELLPSSGRLFLDTVVALSEYFNEQKVNELANKFSTEVDFSPVFFVGFPRSGTTLMEQILKAHPRIVTTDEMSPLAEIIKKIRTISGGYPAGLEHLTVDEIDTFRQRYIERCKELFNNISDTQVVDKLPLNIVHIGLAKILFPKAKFIVALRDPRDACLSCFMQKFELNNAMSNFLDIHNTGLTYQAVMNLWLQYRAIFSDAWIEYKYENLVTEFETTITKVLEFMDVEWTDELNQYREKIKSRAVTTPSYRDVTRKIDNSALERWKGYEQELSPILPILSPFVERFDYTK